MADKPQKIGRKDKLDFLELGLENVPVKIDTGAYTSSIHCEYTNEKTVNGRTILEFRLFSDVDSSVSGKIYETSHFTSRTFKSSFGNQQKRYVIETTVAVFGVIHLIALSLTDRTKMKNPILLGRKFLNKKYIVDPMVTDLSYKAKNKLKV